MHYYVINPSIDKKIVGHYPQVQDIKYNCPLWKEPKFIEHLNNQKADFEPITANGILYKSSKVTDLISVIGMGFTRKLLVSKKFKTILESNRKSGIEFFQSGIFHKEKFIEDYFVLNVYEINLEIIDYLNSIVVLRKRKPQGGSYLEEIKVENYTEFKTILNKKEGLKFSQCFIDRIILKTEIISEDFFALLNVNGGVKFVVSEKLKKEIEDSQCTGIEFMPVEMKLTEWLQGGKREDYYN